MIKKCNTHNNNKIISIEENKRKFIIQNDSYLIINKVKVDGCYQTTGKKCDYLFEVITPIGNTIETVYYVELKGCKLNDALEQLISTINYCSRNHNNTNKIAIAVLSRVPQITSGIQVMKKKLIDLTKNHPIIKNNIVIVNT